MFSHPIYPRICLISRFRRSQLRCQLLRRMQRCVIHHTSVPTMLEADMCTSRSFPSPRLSSSSFPTRSKRRTNATLGQHHLYSRSTRIDFPRSRQSRRRTQLAPRSRTQSLRRKRFDVCSTSTLCEWCTVGPRPSFRVHFPRLRYADGKSLRKCGR